MLGGAVVAGENEQRVFVELQFLEFREQHADAGVEVVGAGGIHEIAFAKIGLLRF